MLIMGCDYHPSVQQIAFVDLETGETGERRPVPTKNSLSVAPVFTMRSADLQSAQIGRPPVSIEVKELIRRMSAANPRWGAPRIHGELGKLGIKVAETTVAKYLVRHRHPPHRAGAPS